MLFYTSKNGNGKIRATYSGRFAFICSLTRGEHKELLNLCNGNDMATLWSRQGGSDFDPVADVLAHEYTHKKIYTLSKTGLILNGYRYWVRTRFLIFNDYKCVKKYYRMRTVLLMETRAYHEDLAHQIDFELSSSKQDIKAIFEKAVKGYYVDRIQHAENRIRTKWKSMGLSFRKPARWHYGKLGKWLHENFAVRITYPGQGNHFTHSVVADKGVSNDLENNRPDDTKGSRIKKFLLRNLIMWPLHYMVNFKARLEWYWTGQRSQYATLKELYAMDYSTFLKEIMQPNILFVMEWAGIPSHNRHRVIEFAEDTLLMDREAFIRRWKPELSKWSSDPHINLYLEFFHLHGN